MAEPISAAQRPANTPLKKNRSGSEPLTTVSDLTGSGIEPQTSLTGSGVFNHYVNRPFRKSIAIAKLPQFSKVIKSSEQQRVSIACLHLLA